MSLDTLGALRVGDLARGDCLPLLWCCEGVPPIERQRLLGAWGFTYKTALMWHRMTPAGKVRMGPGYRARTMHEPVLVATMGNQAFPSCFDGVAREHSPKPEEFYALVDARFSGAVKADLFSRQARPGWDGWGYEAGKFDAGEGAA